jgi:VanZ family protein
VSRWLRAWAPALGWAALIYLVSDQPTIPVDLSDGRDKLAHFAAYSVLGLALGHARVHTGLPIPLLAAIGYLFALSDELHQSFVPGRSAEFGDWVADSLGVLAGLFLHHHWRGRRLRARGRPRDSDR